MAKVAEIRPSPIAGLWYEGNPKILGQQMDEYLAQAVIPGLEGEVVALIAPHAGHRYSGRTAGYAFRCVQGQSYDLVAVISPLHDYFPAPLVTTAHQAYATPLGPVWVDKQTLAELDTALRAANIQMAGAVEDGEHSLEIELPFLQRALQGEFKLLPVMIRGQEPALAEVLGKALAGVLKGKRALLVASTDLSHFKSEDRANQLDAEMLHQIAAFSPKGVFEAEARGSGYACGVAAVAAVLHAARHLGADHVQILHHSTSADETGDTSRVVGYGAAVVLRRAEG